MYVTNNTASRVDNVKIKGSAMFFTIEICYMVAAYINSHIYYNMYRKNRQWISDITFS